MDQDELHQVGRPGSVLKTVEVAPRRVRPVLPISISISCMDSPGKRSRVGLLRSGNNRSRPDTPLLLCLNDRRWHQLHTAI